MFIRLTALLFLTCLIPAYSQDVLTLEQCINYGLKNNLQIQQYSLQVSQKKNELRQKNFSLYPSLNGIASQGFNFGNSLDLTTYEYRKERINSNYFAINSDLTIFNGFYQLNAIKSSRYGYMASMESFQDVADQVSLNIASAYLEILMGIEQVSYAGKQLELSKKLLTRIELMVEVGQENKVKELQLRAQVANDEVSKIEAENMLEQAYLKLKKLMNFTLLKPITVVAPLVDLTMFSDYSQIKMEDFIEESVQRLPKVKKAKMEVESAKYNYLSSLGQSAPRIGLQSSVDTRYSSAARSLGNEKIPFNDQLDNNFGQSLSFGISIPIFNNLQYNYAIQLAKISYKTNEIILEETETTARNEIYQSWMLMSGAGKKYIAALNNLNAQKILFEQNNILYEQGMLNFYDWQAAKNSLSQAESSFLSAKYDYVYKIKVFEYYKGIPFKL